MTAGVNPLAGIPYGVGLSVRDPDPLADRSWQREMERAQIAAWLCHDVAGIAARPGGESVPLSDVTAPTTATAYSTPVAGFAVQGVPSAEDDSALDAHADAGGVTGDAFPRSIPPDTPVAGLGGHWHEERDARHRAELGAVGAGLVEISAAPAPLAHRELARETAWWQQQGESWAALPGLRAALQASSRPTLRTTSTTLSDGELAAARGKLAAGYTGGGRPADAVKLQASAPAGACAPAPREVGKKLFDPSVPAPQAPRLDVVHEPLTLPPSHGQVGTSAASPGGRSRQLGPGAEFGAAIREPVRLHADWSAEGVRLWLGMDASQSTALQAITMQLQRWLTAQGVRLLSISCNGRLVHDLSDTAGAAIFEAQIGPAEALEPPQPPLIFHVKESP